MSPMMNRLLTSGRRPMANESASVAREAMSEPLWLEWVTLAGLLIFASWLLGVRGVFAMLLHADPTGITLVIMVVFAGSTLWCGARSRSLQQQRQAMHAAQLAGPGRAPAGAGWAAAYWAGIAGPARDSGAPLDLLLDKTHGPHSTAWWVNGIQLKLGLLGKVIGFSILALQIGHTTSFDPNQSQELLRSLTTGLGVALLTTMVGLVGNIVLGLQLTRLDRYADALVADCQRIGLGVEAASSPRTVEAVVSFTA
ncbi:MAG: hypothetical protein Q7T97_03580 [Burkholderiaceae bacterium]|nr:hypothetical protein [Burkholderiaceae bacterium]